MRFSRQALLHFLSFHFYLSMINLFVISSILSSFGFSSIIILTYLYHPPPKKKKNDKKLGIHKKAITFTAGQSRPKSLFHISQCGIYPSSTRFQSRSRSLDYKTSHKKRRFSSHGGSALGLSKLFRMRRSDPIA